MAGAMVENVSCWALTVGPTFISVVFMIDKVTPGEILLQVQYNATYPDTGYPDRQSSGSA